MMERGAQTYYYHADHLGSIREITNGAGVTVNSYSYDAYGNFESRSETVANPYAFTGREYDAESGLFYYRARYYDANTGRFISEDPIGFGGGDANLYRYVFNNPVMYRDPSGLMTRCPPGHDFFESECKDLIPEGGRGGGRNSTSQSNFPKSMVGPKSPKFCPEPVKQRPSKGSSRKAEQLKKNKEQGKKGETMTREKLGDDIAGEQVTIESSKGTKARIDFVQKDKSLTETKTGGAGLSKGQKDVFDDVNAGRNVTPRGKRAEEAGLRPGVPVKIPSCGVDRPC